MTSRSLDRKLHLINQSSLERAFQRTLGAILAATCAIAALSLILKWSLTAQITLSAAICMAIAVLLNRSGYLSASILLTLAAVGYGVMHESTMHEGIRNVGLGSFRR